MNLQDFTCKCKKNSHLMLFPTCIFKACNYGNLLWGIDNYSVVWYKKLGQQV